MICANPEFGRELLQTAGFGFSESELLAVELPRRNRQPIQSICSALLSAELNIHYAYPLLVRARGGAAMALYVDDLTLAAQILIKKGFTLISQNDFDG